MENVIVLFEVTLREGKMEGYLERAGQLKRLLQDTPGCIRAERFSSLTQEGKLLSLSVWENEESVSRWRNLPAHRINQAYGRETAFSDYKITVASVSRCYGKNERAEAPADANRYFGWEG